MSNSQIPTLSEVKQRFSRFNRTVKRNVPNPVTLRGKFPYGVTPTWGGGTTEAFNSIRELYAYLLLMEKMSSPEYAIIFEIVDGEIQPYGTAA